VKPNIYEMPANFIRLNRTVADKDAFLINQHDQSVEQVPPMTQRRTLPDHRDLWKHMKNLKTSYVELIRSERNEC
jgi:hypothetical protein